MNVACQIVLVDLVLELPPHRPFAHQYEMAVLEPLVRQLRHANKHFRSLLGREATDEAYKRRFWRDLDQGMKVIGLGSRMEDFCIDSVRNEAQFCAWYAQSQRLKVGGFWRRSGAWGNLRTIARFDG